MAIGGQGRAAMAIDRLGQAIWRMEGTEDGGLDLELELKV
jgi:hypothetical protein